MLTEGKMWDSLKLAKVAIEQLTRIEAVTALGIADVEYVSSPWHGWIELKVSRTMTDFGKVTFGHELTIQQLTWLLQHHNPKFYLRSWLLIGRHDGGNMAAEWVLVQAPAAAPLIKREMTWQELRRRPGVIQGMKSPHDVLRAIGRQ